MNHSPQALSSCQEDALSILEDSADNVFLTGDAGTGKSWLVRRFLRELDRKTFPIVASTGVAAVLVGGRTFHSFFGLGIMEGGFEKTVERALGNKRVIKRLRLINGFVLDEVSMIPGAALRAAEEICRRARQKQMPWGGARVIAVGDFAQLPPVTRDGQPRDWAFRDETWARSGFTSVVLKTVMRTEDAGYLSVLSRIRRGEVDDVVREFLSARVDPDISESRATFLAPTRIMADRQNTRRLAEIDSPLKDFQTEYTGAQWAVEQLRKSCPVGDFVKLKVGARVMIRVNDAGYQYVNGSIGTIEAFGPLAITIKLTSGRVIELERHTFALTDADGNESAHAVNFPVSLAYAMTIHKSQGVTLDRMTVNLNSLWEPGQAYVALSRLTSGDGLTITGWDEASIMADAEVTEFHASLG